MAERERERNKDIGREKVISSLTLQITAITSQGQLKPAVRNSVKAFYMGGL